MIKIIDTIERISEYLLWNKVGMDFDRNYFVFLIENTIEV